MNGKSKDKIFLTCTMDFLYSIDLRKCTLCNINNKLEAAHAEEITKLVEYVDRKEDALIQVVRTRQQNTDSAVLQAARSLKTEVQKETRKMKDSIAEKTKENGTGRGCMDNCHVT